MQEVTRSLAGPLPLKANDASSHAADPEPPSSGGSKLLDTGNARQKFYFYVEGNRIEAAELPYDRARNRAEIERVVRIKQAEAKLFQVRADEARQEAEGLQRIISRKREKIDEEYACKYAKLRLSEAEERHQKRLEELRSIENEQQDFQKMKVRMEAEIKELMMEWAAQVVDKEKPQVAEEVAQVVDKEKAQVAEKAQVVGRRKKAVTFAGQAAVDAEKNTADEQVAVAVGKRKRNTMKAVAPAGDQRAALAEIPVVAKAVVAAETPVVAARKESELRSRLRKK